MPRRYAAPMPDNLRHTLRATQHPARSVACPHCGAQPHRACTTPSKRRILAQPHPKRITAWARTTACCPDCQVTPGTPCHDNGHHRTDVHDRRIQEAKETLA